MPILNWVNEERPSILQVGDHGHANHAGQQLKPAAGAPRGVALSHCFLQVYSSFIQRDAVCPASHRVRLGILTKVRDFSLPTLGVLEPGFLRNCPPVVDGIPARVWNRGSELVNSLL